MRRKTNVGTGAGHDDITFAGGGPLAGPVPDHLAIPDGCRGALRMIRVLALAGGLAGAATLSQYPEFSQQYLQRLAGQVDALSVVVRDFDTSALEAGMGREEALGQMTGQPFLIARQADMRRTFARHAVLSDNLAVLSAASPVARLAMPHRLGDADTLRATLADFQPAVPLSVAGLTAAGAGFVGGGTLMTMLLGLVLLPFRRRPRRTDHLGRPLRDGAPGRTVLHVHAAPQATQPATRPARAEPPVERPRPVLVPDTPPRPRLMGEKRT